jgi:hypothetical protein
MAATGAGYRRLVTDKWDTPTLDELTEAESQADQRDVYTINGGSPGPG